MSKPTFAVHLMAWRYGTKIPIIALVKKRTGMGLAATKEAVEAADPAAPLLIDKGLSRGEADVLRAAFNELGGGTMLVQEKQKG